MFVIFDIVYEESVCGISWCVVCVHVCRVGWWGALTRSVDLHVNCSRELWWCVVSG